MLRIGAIRWNAGAIDKSSLGFALHDQLSWNEQQTNQLGENPRLPWALSQRQPSRELGGAQAVKVSGAMPGEIRLVSEGGAQKEPRQG